MKRRLSTSLIKTMVLALTNRWEYVFKVSSNFVCPIYFATVVYMVSKKLSI